MAKEKFSIANQTVAPGLDNIGLVCDALWTDFDNDGWVDLLIPEMDAPDLFSQ